MDKYTEALMDDLVFADDSNWDKEVSFNYQDNAMQQMYDFNDEYNQYGQDEAFESYDDDEYENGYAQYDDLYASYNGDGDGDDDQWDNDYAYESMDDDYDNDYAYDY